MYSRTCSFNTHQSALTKISCGTPVVIPHSGTTGNTIENTIGKYHRIFLWFFGTYTTGYPVVLLWSCGNTTQRYHRKYHRKYHSKIPQDNIPVVFWDICHRTTTGQYQTAVPHRSTTHQYHTAIPHIITQQYHTAIPHRSTTQQNHTSVPHSSNTTHQYHTSLPHSSTTQAQYHRNTTQHYHSNTTWIMHYHDKVPRVATSLVN